MHTEDELKNASTIKEIRALAENDPEIKTTLHNSVAPVKGLMNEIHFWKKRTRNIKCFLPRLIYINYIIRACGFTNNSLKHLSYCCT